MTAGRDRRFTTTTNQMKLTIEIPDEHRLDVLRFLASLTAAPVEAAPDIAPGHPELPLGMETAKPEDPTRRVLPWGDLPAPPPAPAGKVWVYRGTFEGECIYADGREVRYLGRYVWAKTKTFATSFHHIELVDSVKGR